MCCYDSKSISLKYNNPLFRCVSKRGFNNKKTIKSNNKIMSTQNSQQTLYMLAMMLLKLGTRAVPIYQTSSYIQ
jgi:hypothetical protein